MTDRKGGARVVKFRGEVWLWVTMADVRSRLLNVTKLPSRAGSHFPELGEERTATHFAISVRMKSANSFGARQPDLPPAPLAPCESARYSTHRWHSVSMMADGVPAGAGSPI